MSELTVDALGDESLIAKRDSEMRLLAELIDKNAAPATAASRGLNEWFNRNMHLADTRHPPEK